MSLLDRVRVTFRPPQSDPADLPWWRVVVPGAAAAALTWWAVALPALVVWVVTPRSPGGFGDVLALASGVWFLATGTPISVGDGVYGVVPLAAWALAVAVAARCAGRVLDVLDPDTSWTRERIVTTLVRFHGGYAAVALGAGLLSLAGQARPTMWALVGVVAVPALGTIVALARRLAHETAPAPLRRWVADLPVWVRRAPVPGLFAAAVALGCGMVLVLVALTLRIGTVVSLHSAIGPGVLGGVALTVAQALFLPNAAVWGLAWLAGPGFDIAAGSSISVTGARPGLMPMIPLFGALPTEADYPGWTVLALLVPVAVGAVAAWRACAGLARLSSWRTKLRGSLAAAAVAAVVLGAATVASGGPAGDERLRHLGPNPLLVVPVLFAELAVGAALYVLVIQLRDRWVRRPR